MIALEVALFLIFIVCHACLWSRVKPLPEHPAVDWVPDPDSPRVSFLVPAWNAEHHIPAFVETYRSLVYPDKELIMCAGGDDKSLEIAMSFAARDVKVIEQLHGDGRCIAVLTINITRRRTVTGCVVRFVA